MKETIFYYSNCVNSSIVISKADIIKSVPGSKGGYMLNKAPEDINLWDVIVAIEGTGSFFNCKEIRQQSSYLVQ
ncbi:Rrf2 family transcriptional regulator [Mollicutes bacterium LVI A0078]|nr:Rrf2 family transcriptional regulator [Mollicutes bacterium LVI A0075]WOO91886.1 Rrf2 family transcriptional regulator [Mollicutes bacterium LVI A0078]